VGVEGFGWAASSPLEHSSHVLSLLADVVQNPTFPESEVDTERAALLGEIALARDDMYRQPLRLALEAAFAGHPYGRPVYGDDKSVARISAEDVTRHHAEHALAGPLLVAVAADRNEDELAEEIATLFEGLTFEERPPVSEPAWRRESERRTEARDKEQTGIAVLSPSCARREDARFAAELIGAMGSGLGGRFFDELREKQSLAYSVQAWPIMRRSAGAFAFYIATSPEKEERAMAGLFGEMRKLREESVTAEELDRAREYLTGMRAVRLQSGAAVLGEMVDAWLYGTGLEELNEVDDRLKSVTTAQILQFAQTHFDEGRFAVGIVRGRVPV
jgi:zinc protease